MRAIPAEDHTLEITQVGQMKGKSFKGIAYQCKYANHIPKHSSIKYSQRKEIYSSSKLKEILSRVLFNYTEQRQRL